MTEEKKNTLLGLARHLEDCFYAPAREEFEERRQVANELGDRSEELRSLGLVMDERAIESSVNMAPPTSSSSATPP